MLDKDYQAFLQELANPTPESFPSDLDPKSDRRATPVLDYATLRQLQKSIRAKPLPPPSFPKAPSQTIVLDKKKKKKILKKGTAPPP